MLFYIVIERRRANCAVDPRGLPIGGDIGSGQRRPREHHIKERRRNPAAERAKPSTAHRCNAPEVPTSSPPAARALTTCLCREGLHILERHRASHQLTRSVPLLYKIKGGAAAARPQGQPAIGAAAAGAMRAPICSNRSGGVREAPLSRAGCAGLRAASRAGKSLRRRGAWSRRGRKSSARPSGCGNTCRRARPQSWSDKFMRFPGL